MSENKIKTANFSDEDAKVFAEYAESITGDLNISLGIRLAAKLLKEKLKKEGKK